MTYTQLILILKLLAISCGIVLILCILVLLIAKKWIRESDSQTYDSIEPKLKKSMKVKVKTDNILLIGLIVLSSIELLVNGNLDITKTFWILYVLYKIFS